MKIRHLKIDDYDELIRLWDKARLPYKPKGRDRRDHIGREIEKPTAIFLVAEKDGKIVGSILGTHDGRKGWINRLAVHPDHRRQGIARRLVIEVEKRLDKLGIKIIACFVEDGNKSSLDFFEKIGYKKFTGVVYLTKRSYPGV